MKIPVGGCARGAININLKMTSVSVRMCASIVIQRDRNGKS